MPRRWRTATYVLGNCTDLLCPERKTQTKDAVGISEGDRRRDRWRSRDLTDYRTHVDCCKYISRCWITDRDSHDLKEAPRFVLCRNINDGRRTLWSKQTIAIIRIGDFFIRCSVSMFGENWQNTVRPMSPAVYSIYPINGCCGAGGSEAMKQLIELSDIIGRGFKHIIGMLTIILGTKQNRK